MGRSYGFHHLPDNKMPFACNGGAFYTNDPKSTHKISFYSLDFEDKLIDAKWLPPSVASTTYVNDYVNRKIAESAAETQSDWNNTEVSSTSYIKNKPFGYLPDMIKNNEFVCSSTSPVMGDLYCIVNSSFKLQEETYIVTWDGTEYELTAHKNSFAFSGMSGNDIPILGDQRIMANAGATMGSPIHEENVPFCIVGMFLLMANTAQNANSQHTISIRLKNNYQKIKLSDLPDEVININPDWDQEDPTAQDYIKNKPTFSAQKQADWNQTDSEALDFIKNKPTIPSLPTYYDEFGLMNYKGKHLVYTGEKWDGIYPDPPDWQVTNNLDSRYIHNKPFGEIGEILRIEEFTLGPIAGVDYTASFYSNVAPIYFDIGKTYQINITGQIYTNICQELNSDLGFAVCFGNGKIASDIFDLVPVGGVVDTGENYVIVVLIENKGTSDQITSIALVQIGQHPKQTLSISSTEIKKIDKKFLPDEVLNQKTPVDTTLTKPGVAADAKKTGDKIKELDGRIYLGKEYAGQLLYVGEDGYPAILRIGGGLTVKNGVLMVVQSTDNETTSELDVGILDKMILPEE